MNPYEVEKTCRDVTIISTLPDAGCIGDALKGLGQHVLLNRKIQSRTARESTPSKRDLDQLSGGPVLVSRPWPDTIALLACNLGVDERLQEPALKPPSIYRLVNFLKRTRPLASLHKVDPLLVVLPSVPEERKRIYSHLIDGRKAIVVCLAQNVVAIILLGNELVLLQTPRQSLHADFITLPDVVRENMFSGNFFGTVTERGSPTEIHNRNTICNYFTAESPSPCET
jgi:hypothetical protein